MSKTPLTIATIKALHQAGQLEEARHAYLDLLAAEPTQVEAMHLLAVLYAEENQWDEAIAYLKQALQHKPNDPSLLLHLATIRKTMGDLEEAESILKSLIEAAPAFAAAYNNLGALYSARGKWQEAARYYQAAIDQQADYVDAYYNLGLAQRNAKQFDAAKHAFIALLELSPSHPGAIFQLGCLAMNQADYKKAFDYFELVAKAHPHHLETQLNLGACCLKLGWLSNAKSHYLKALDIAPNDTQALFNVGVLMMYLGHEKEAIDYYLRAVKEDSNFFDAHNNLGAAYLLLNDHANATVHFREALRIQPDNETVRHTLRILTGDKSMTTTPLPYVRDLFDSYAARFDNHLLQSLHYEVPEQLMAVLRDACELNQVHWDIVDLGCGTGLCGVLLRDALPSGIHSLVGVDISPGMLAQAKQKQCYDDLVEGDIVSFLNAHARTYDLLVAGDVLVYFGELDVLFAAAARALKPRGYWLFNTEKNTKTDHEMLNSGRFAHSKDYIDSLAAQLDFEIVTYRVVTLRTEQHQQVEGQVYLLQLK